jgi:hypothetical protein
MQDRAASFIPGEPEGLAMVDVSRECCERYFGMDDELFDYTMAALRWLLALCERVA